MIHIQYAKMKDKPFWYQLDKHMSETEFENKIKTQRAYILFDGETPIGILRYNLFWDNIPFCTLLFIHSAFQGRGYGRILMKYWEKDMKQQGYGMVLTSTQTDETAQHFYRKLGYQDCGCLVLNIPKYAQPMEMFLAKEI